MQLPQLIRAVTKMESSAGKEQFLNSQTIYNIIHNDHVNYTCNIIAYSGGSN